MIQMYHGDETRHLIIFVNGEIIQIAFNQADSKVYSFLIEQQLLELELKRDGDDFSYEMTPQPMQADIQEEPTFGHQFWIPLIFLLLILNLAFYLYKSLNLG